MKATHPGDDQIVLEFGKREGNLFLATLKRYPVINSACQPLSKGGSLSDPEESQKLLEEALAEQRAENRKQLAALMADPQRFVRTGTGWRLVLPTAEIEWLLQVLNDIRVGSWIKLGCPDHKPSRLAISAGQLSLASVKDFWAMEVAGLFQMQLLGALQRIA